MEKIEKVQRKSKFHVAAFIICLVVPWTVGIISGLISSSAMASYENIVKPPLSPPGAVFPIAWGILYTLMGIGSYQFYISDKDDSLMLMFVYLIQLFFNFLWSPIYFNAKLYWVALVWLMIMWLMIIYIVVKSYRVSKLAMIMFVPYLLWCTFAAYLNLMTAILN